MLTFLTAEKKLHSLKIFYLHCLNYNKYVFCPGIFLIVNLLFNTYIMFSRFVANSDAKECPSSSRWPIYYFALLYSTVAGKETCIVGHLLATLQ